MNEILIQNEEFLLQQLNDVEVVLEGDSIYTPEMGRDERFDRYEVVMRERIGKARSGAAKKTLGVLMEFVLSRR